jgi:hypothetical protein
MSGPKVIRVRWRLLDSAQALDELADTIEEWRRCLERHGTLAPAKTSRAEARLRELEELQRAGRWRAVLPRARAETQALRQEMDEIRAETVRRAEEARDRRRRLHAAARTVAESLASEGGGVPTEIENVLARALGAKDEELAALEAAIDHALAGSLHATEAPPTMSVEQQELADRLRGELVARETVANRARYRAHEDRDRRLDVLLAEVETFDDPAVARDLIERAAIIAAEPLPDRRGLLTDSLILEVAALTKARRAAEEAAHLLAAARAKVRRLAGVKARALEARIDAALASPAVPEAKRLATAVESLAVTEAARKGAGETRRAVLQGLADLGYEVHEDMATAWAEGARIVLRKPATPGYGVELGVPPDADRLQVRVVAFAPTGAARDTSRDADVEGLWCSEVEQLRALLNDAGYGTEMERAAPPGTVPLKTVADRTDREEGTEVRQAPRTRRRSESR